MDVTTEIEILETDVKDVEKKCKKVNCVAIYDAIMASFKLRQQNIPTTPRDSPCLKNVSPALRFWLSCVKKTDKIWSFVANIWLFQDLTMNYDYETPRFPYRLQDPCR